jgi:hypothetical protein
LIAPHAQEIIEEVLNVGLGFTQSRFIRVTDVDRNRPSRALGHGPTMVTLLRFA